MTTSRPPVRPRPARRGQRLGGGEDFQVDEPALRETPPLRVADRPDYLV
ncbi:hypothetical protein [Streptomyces sp. NPDC004270]